MENKNLETLNSKISKELGIKQNNELDVLNLKKKDKSNKEIDFGGTGVKPLRFFAVLILVIGAVIFLAGIINLMDSSRYNSEKLYGGIICIYVAVSFFILSPILNVLATIGEAAKIYKDKNIQGGCN